MTSDDLLVPLVGKPLFVLAVHLGPAAGAVTNIPEQYGSAIADVGALALLVAALVLQSGHKTLSMGSPERP